MIEHMGVELQTDMALGKDFTLAEPPGRGLRRRVPRRRRPAGRGPGHPRRGRRGHVPTPCPSSRRTTSAARAGGQERRRHRRRQLGHRRRPHRPAPRRRERHGRLPPHREAMPAYEEEIEEAEHEGVELLTLVAPVEIVRDASGKVTGVRCKPMALGEFDRTGRRRPEAGDNPAFVIQADHVLVAIGQTLDAPAVLDGTPVELNRWGFLAANPVTGQTSRQLDLRRRRRRHRPVVGRRGHGAGEKAAAAHRPVPDRRQPRLLAPRHRAADVLRPRRRPRAGRPPRGRGTGRWAAASTTSTKSSSPGPQRSPSPGEALPALRLRQVRAREQGEREDANPRPLTGSRVEVPEGTTILQAGPDRPASRSPRSATSRTCRPSAPAACASSRSRAPAPSSPRAPAGDRGHGRQDQHRRVRDGRQMVVELLLSEHNGDCQTCDRTADCELQTLAAELGIRDLRYAGEKTRKLIDDSTPALVRDTGKCIKCRRCVTRVQRDPGRRRPVRPEPRLRDRDRPGLHPGPERRRLRAVRPVRGRLPRRRHPGAQPDRRGLERARRPRPRRDRADRPGHPRRAGRVLRLRRPARW